jgi:hypothetical protein
MEDVVPLPAPVIALTIVMATSFGLLISGRRYLRGYVVRHGRQPPATWMFRRSDDAELEGLRRVALALLPFYLIAAVIYLLRP